jgi:CRISPR-associated protein Csx3
VWGVVNAHENGCNKATVYPIDWLLFSRQSLPGGSPHEKLETTDQTVKLGVMAQPLFTITDLPQPEGYTCRLVEFAIPDGVTTPSQFADALDAVAPQLAGAVFVLVSGRGPVWGYGMICHVAHATLGVATHDPRLGYVVVQTHDARFQMGQILTVQIER